MHAGAIDDAERALAPVRAFGPPALDSFAPVAYAAFQRSLDMPPGRRNWWTAEYLDNLTDGAIDAIASLSTQLPAGPAQILIREVLAPHRTGGTYLNWAAEAGADRVRAASGPTTSASRA